MYSHAKMSKSCEYKIEMNFLRFSGRNVSFTERLHGEQAAVGPEARVKCPGVQVVAGVVPVRMVVTWLMVLLFSWNQL